MRVDKNRAAAAALLLGVAISLSAHSMDQAAVLLDFRDHAIDAELQLPADRLLSVLGTQAPASVSAYVLNRLSASLPDGRTFEIQSIADPYLSRIEGAPYVVACVRLIPPAGAPAGLFDLHCGVLIDRIPSQVILVSIRTDWRTSTFADESLLAGVVRGSDRTIRLDRRSGNWWRGFGSILHLGMRHIAEGTDHLLFLLVLLIPAPLLCVSGRWMGYADIRQALLGIARVVTAFTAGHSVTLAAGALNLVHAPTRPVEVLIAASILVSAVHALRPLFPGREAVIAGSFGFVHGMAFATTLAGLGLRGWERVAGIFGFNLGIEAMQLLFVAAALPSLILLSRTRVYRTFRIAGALLAGSVAAAWIVQRIWDLPNPADPLLAAVAQRAGWVAAGLTLLAIFARVFERRDEESA